MAFTFDEETRKISMPPGDTGNIWLEIDWPAMKAGDAVIFAIVSRREGDMLLKAAEVEQDAESGLYRAHIRLCNHDTRDIEPGTYNWQVRLVTDPVRDENGNVIADECTDNVISVFGGDSMPVFRMERKGGRV